MPRFAQQAVIQGETWQISSSVIFENKHSGYLKIVNMRILIQLSEKTVGQKFCVEGQTYVPVDDKLGLNVEYGRIYLENASSNC